MKIHPLFALGILAAGLGAQNGAAIMAEVGATAGYTFNNPLANGRGVRSLDDLRGAPTMIEFWGVR